MKEFTTQEIRDLFNRVMIGEISFPEMVEMMNEMAGEEEKCIEDIPTYKKGDFLVKEYKDGSQYIFILDYIDDGGLIYYHCCHSCKYDATYVTGDFGIGRIGDARHKCLRYATDLEKELLIAKLSKVKKRWNAEKKCVEDIPVRKFKKGDKVRIKDGISSKTHCYFLAPMDDFIGTTMTVYNTHYEASYVVCDEPGFVFHEDWLEPYTDELKKGDLAIFWDVNKGSAFIGEYDCFLKDTNYPHRGNRGNVWANAIKFESKEQYEKLIKGEM